MQEVNIDRDINLTIENTASSLLDSKVSSHGGVLYSVVKRCFDFTVAFLALILSSPLFLLISIAIAVDSKGGVIFRQERLGLRGKPFMMYKFRSMRADAEINGACWAEKDDPRVTRVGKFIRLVRLDEIPQLINIIKGDMSIVGPRPERACFYDEFEKYIPHFRKRLEVIPGLTGWAQVNGGYDLAPEEKIVYDLEYIRKRTVWMDLKCIFLTIRVVFKSDGAR